MLKRQSSSDVPTGGGPTQSDAEGSAGTPLSAVDLGAVAMLIAMMVALHLGIPGLVPSGSDGGNWLALAKEGLGLDVMSAETVYPPVYVSFLALLLGLMSTVAALTVSALVAKLALVLALFWMARPAGRIMALTVAAVVGLAGAQTEAYAWGAYPQLLATAFALLATHQLAKSLRTRSWWDVILGGAWALLTAATHLLIGGLLPVALGLVSVHWLLSRRSSWPEWWRGVVTALLVALPAIIVFVVSWVSASALDVDPVLNPLGVDYLEGFTRLIREASIVWLVVFGVAIAGMLWPYWGMSRIGVVSSGSGWLIAGIAFFFATGEPRSLLLSQIGAVLLAGVVLSAILGSLRVGAHQKGRRAPRVGRNVIGLLLLSLVAGLMAGGVAAYVDSTDWYRVVDQDELEALASLADRSERGDLVLASKGHHGNPVGWWVEGYAELPTYTAIEADALMFAEEHEQAAVANAYFDEETSTEDAKAILRSTGARFIVVDRRGEHARWLETAHAGSLERIHDSETLVVLEVAG